MTDVTELCERLRELLEKAAPGELFGNTHHLQYDGGRTYGLLQSKGELVPIAAVMLAVEGMPDDQGRARVQLIVETVNALPMLLRALSTLPDTIRDERAGWLPIETFVEPTALSSGAGVLVADKDGTVGEAYYRNFGDSDDGWWWANTSWGDYPEPDRPNPTSWRPLPDLPIESGQHLKDRGEGK